MRICDLCGTIDDGPRHVIAHAPGGVPVDAVLIAEIERSEGVPSNVRDAAVLALSDTTLQIRHPSCCAASGCDVCTQEEN